MLVGVKIGEKNPEHAERMNEYVDFFEIYAKPEFKINLRKYGKPVVVHVAHFWNGVNFASFKRKSINQEALDHAKRLADMHGSKKIVFHPELDEGDGCCSIDELLDFIGSNCDERLLIENMPYTSQDFVHYCYNPEETGLVSSLMGVGVCFDFSHLAAYAKRMEADLEENIEKFRRLNPKHFHLSDSDLNEVSKKGYDEKHLNLFEGNVNVNLAKNYVPSDAMLTLETPPDMKKQIREIEWLKS